jgi:hypothetical protein
MTPSLDSSRAGARTYPIAHVGWTGSNADKQRTAIAAQVLVDRRPPPARYARRLARTALRSGVKFDLSYQGDPDDRYGSDFLIDQRAFALVILHRVFVGWDDNDDRTAAGPLANLQLFASSPNHSPKAWRRRLQDSQAQLILAFGGSDCVAASFLESLPGYEHRLTPFGALYTLLPKDA